MCRWWQRARVATTPKYDITLKDRPRYMDFRKQSVGHSLITSGEPDEDGYFHAVLEGYVRSPEPALTLSGARVGDAVITNTSDGVRVLVVVHVEPESGGGDYLAPMRNTLLGLVPPEKVPAYLRDVIEGR
jgi:hypothetical protein